MDNKQILQNDILRYKTNKLPANLALLGLVFNVLYFCLLYGFKTVYVSDGVTTNFVRIEIGISVILTLVTLLTTFLASEGIKGYNKKFSIVLLVLAAFQILRIFGYPLYGLQNDLLTIPYFWIRPTTSTFEFIMMLVWLLASAACLIASAVLGYIRSVQLEKHVAAIESGELNIEAVLKASDAEEEAAKEVAPSEEIKEVE